MSRASRRGFCIAFIAALGCSSLGLADEIVVLHDARIVAGGRYLVARDDRDCSTWRYFPRLWAQVPGSFSAAVKMREEGQARRRRVYPEAYYTAAFAPADDPQALGQMAAEVKGIQDAEDGAEAMLIAQERLKPEDALYHGHCDPSATPKLVRLRSDSLLADYLRSEDPTHPGDWIEFRPRADGTDQMLVTRRIALLKGNGLDQLMRSLTSAQIPWGQIVPGVVSVRSKRIELEAWLTADDRAFARFERFIRQPICEDHCVENCGWHMTWHGPWHSCDTSCAHVCSQPVDRTFLVEAQNAGEVKLEVRLLGDSRYDYDLAVRKLIDSFILSNFAERAEATSAETRRIVIGQERKTGVTHFSTAIRLFADDQLSLQDSIELRPVPGAAGLSGLRDFESSPFYRCFRELADADQLTRELGSIYEGYYTEKLPCPGYPLFDRRPL
jgi:hypothetical protein